MYLSFLQIWLEKMGHGGEESMKSRRMLQKRKVEHVNDMHSIAVDSVSLVAGEDGLVVPHRVVDGFCNMKENFKMKRVMIWG